MARNQSPSRAASCFVGLMSGTSADGIDAVVASISGEDRRLRARLISHTYQEFPPKLRRRVLSAALHGTVAEICELNFILGEHFASAALSAIRKAKLKPGDIAAIGSHGQTLHHLPGAVMPSTLQIGEPCVIAERTGITTIADFRTRDMAAGGQGAPLVPFADWAMFTHPKRPRIVQNLGGIGNLTFLPASATLNDVIAFDTGPANMVVDAVVLQLTRGRQSFDRDGKMAAQGNVSKRLLAECLKHPFIKRRPPKTTGREEFGETFVRWLLSRARKLKLSDADLVATATDFTAATIADAYRRFILPKLGDHELKRLQIVLGGGGVRNPTLTRMLHGRINAGTLVTHEDFGVDSSAKEALAFAILAHQTLARRPGNVPSATGAKRAVVLGKIVYG